MNEQLQNLLSTAITSVGAKLDGSLSFLSSEMPETLRQVFLWAYTSDCISLLLFLIWIVAYIMLLKNIFTKGKKSKSNFLYDVTYEEPTEVGIIIAFTVSCITLFILIFAVAVSFDLAQLILTPRVWLINYIANMA